MALASQVEGEEAATEAQLCPTSLINIWLDINSY